jgi:hypothetical protein
MLSSKLECSQGIPDGSPSISIAELQFHDNPLKSFSWLVNLPASNSAKSTGTFDDLNKTINSPSTISQRNDILTILNGWGFLINTTVDIDDLAQCPKNGLLSPPILSSVGG